MPNTGYKPTLSGEREYIRAVFVLFWVGLFEKKFTNILIMMYSYEFYEKCD